MVGVCDSGAGGMFAAKRINRALPRLDILYLADRKNAPYGSKSGRELVPLVVRDIERLAERGAEKILIACCTASTVYERLPTDYKKISLPIIRPTARRAVTAGAKKIGIAATEATVRSGAFEREINALSGDVSAVSFSVQSLVFKVECGLDTSPEVSFIRDKLVDEKCDTVILGYTHFSAIKDELRRLMPSVNIVDSAEAAADEIINNTENKGTGKILYM